MHQYGNGGNDGRHDYDGGMGGAPGGGMIM